jgi:hypothetical protein
MINKLTSNKMENTYLESKDKKGYIFDIRRPSMISNTETYEGEDASFKGLETRTGLGNRVLRRVNFIKPEIQPRKVMEGKLTVTKDKTLEDMIKEGFKIKYEEPDPWDLQWLEERNKIINRLTNVNRMNKKEIDDYLQKYPPLGRTQRTRPVNRNPFEDANKSIKEQLKNVGTAVQQVSTDVKNNTLNANNINTQQMTNKVAMDNWIKQQYAQLEGIQRQTNIDTVNGQNMLGAKLQEVVNKIGMQNALTQQLLMNSLQSLNIDVDAIDTINIDSLNDTDVQLAVLKLINNYYPGKNIQDLKFDFKNENGAIIDVDFSDMYSRMRESRYIYLNNDKINKKVTFEYDVKDVLGKEPTKSVTEPKISFLPSLPEEEYIEGNIIPEDETRIERKYSDDDEKLFEDNIDKINETIKKALELVADTDYKEAYENMLKLGDVPKAFKRILKINVDYEDDKFLDTSLIQSNNLTKDYKDKDVFDYTYKKGDKYAYFVWYSKFGSHQSTGKNWIALKQFIYDEIIKERKIQSKEYETKAVESSTEAEKSATEAEKSAKRAKEEAEKTAKRAKEAVEKAKEEAEKEAESSSTLKDLADAVSEVNNNSFPGIMQDEKNDNEKRVYILNEIDNSGQYKLKYYSTYGGYNKGKNVRADIPDKTDLPNNVGNIKKIGNDIVLILSSISTNRNHPNILNNINKEIQEKRLTKGSGIRAFHKKNRLPIYKNSMNDSKGKGLKLAGQGRKANPWLMHVKKYRESHPNLKYSEVLKQAKSTYKK